MQEGMREEEGLMEEGRRVSGLGWSMRRGMEGVGGVWVMGTGRRKGFELAEKREKKRERDRERG